MKTIFFLLLLAGSSSIASMGDGITGAPGSSTNGVNPAGGGVCPLCQSISAAPNAGLLGGNGSGTVGGQSPVAGDDARSDSH